MDACNFTILMRSLVNLKGSLGGREKKKKKTRTSEAREREASKLVALLETKGRAGQGGSSQGLHGRATDYEGKLTTR